MTMHLNGDAATAPKVTAEIIQASVATAGGRNAILFPHFHASACGYNHQEDDPNVKDLNRLEGIMEEYCK
jgi:hypothetical protein